MKTDLTQLTKRLWMNNPHSEFYRFCVHCDNCISIKSQDYLCEWFKQSCYMAVRTLCPIPTSNLTSEHGNALNSEATNRRESKPQKGGTVVPPSDFQSVTTECAEYQQNSGKTSRPCASASACTRKEPLAPTLNLHPKCSRQDCPYSGESADYCRICTANSAVNRIHADEMCLHLVLGDCDGHNCECERYIRFL